MLSEEWRVLRCLRSHKNFLILHSALNIRHSNPTKIKGSQETTDNLWSSAKADKDHDPLMFALIFSFSKNFDLGRVESRMQNAEFKKVPFGPAGGPSRTVVSKT